MPIEIQILSGSRQGEQLRLDAEAIRVGDGADCQLRFSSDTQPAVRGRRALLRLNQEGWQLSNQGTGEWFVNHSPVPPQGTSPLRSGDIVRLSATGPDFMFSVVSSRQPAVSPSSSGDSRLANTQVVHATSPPEGAHSIPNPPADVASAPSPSSRDRGPNVTVAMDLPLPVVLVGGGVVIVACIVLAIVVSSRGERTPTVSAIDTRPPIEPLPPSSTDKKSGEVPEAQPQPSPRLSPPPLEPSPKPSSALPTKLSADELVEKFSAAVVWIGFEEKNGQKLPLCSGWAVTPNIVVTTASSVVDLQKLKSEGLRVFVAHGPPTPQQMITVNTLRTHPRYGEHEGDARSSVFHNVGALTLESPLPVFCELLPAAKLPKPVIDMKVTVLGYPITKENYKPFDTVRPLAMSRSSGRVKDSRPLAGISLLVLDLTGSEGINGGPVFDSAGKVIGLMWQMGDESRGVPHAVLADYVQELLQ